MSLLKNLFYQNRITSLLLIIALALSFALAPAVQLNAAEGGVDCFEVENPDDYPECREEDDEEYPPEEAGTVNVTSEEETITPAGCDTPDSASKKECQIPETGPGSVAISLLGVSILGYGARKWMASRHAMHEAMDDLYKNN